MNYSHTNLQNLKQNYHAPNFRFYGSINALTEAVGQNGRCDNGKTDLQNCNGNKQRTQA